MVIAQQGLRARDLLEEAIDDAHRMSQGMATNVVPTEAQSNLIGQLRTFVDDLDAGEVPEQFPLQSRDIMDGFDPLHFHLSFSIKSILNQYGMWAIVDKTWTKALADHIGSRHALEVMAGTGWLTRALRGHGVSMSSSDDLSWRDRHTLAKGEGTVEAITNLDALEAVKAFPHAEVLIVSWPPYDDDFIVKVCDAWGTERPIIFIGEGDGGCTACDEFFENYESEYLDVAMPRHHGIHDYVQVGHWSRK